MIVVWLLVVLHILFVGTTSKPATLGDFNPMKGYGPKPTTWKQFQLKNEISVSIAEFTKNIKDCVRVVHFAVKGEALGAVEVPCDQSDLFMGLVYIDDTLWYYAVASVGHRETPWSGLSYELTYIEGESTCKQNTVSFITDEKGTKKIYEENVLSSASCQYLIERNNVPPMSMMLYQADVRKIDSSKFTLLSSYNYGKTVGARIYQYRNGWVCYRLLRIYSLDRELHSMITTCGPVEGVVMLERTFSTRKAMVQLQDKEENTFTLFINPSNGNEPPEVDEETPKCIKETLKLIEKENRYVKKRQDTVIEYELQSPQCRDFVEGKYDSKSERDERVLGLLNIFRNNELDLDKEILNKVANYMVILHQDYNLAYDLGMVVLRFKKLGSNYKTGIFVVARGAVLTGYIVEDNTDTEDLEISGNTLYYNKDLMANQAQDTFTVVIKHDEGSCAQHTYEVTGPNEKRKIGTKLLNASDSYCKDIFKRKLAADEGIPK